MNPFDWIVVRFEWKPQDLWIGAFWKWDRLRAPSTSIGETTYKPILHVWICFLPCVPLHIEWWKEPVP